MKPESRILLITTCVAVVAGFAGGASAYVLFAPMQAKLAAGGSVAYVGSTPTVTTTAAPAPAAAPSPDGAAPPLAPSTPTTVAASTPSTDVSYRATIDATDGKTATVHLSNGAGGTFQVSFDLTKVPSMSDVEVKTAADLQQTYGAALQDPSKPPSMTDPYKTVALQASALHVGDVITFTSASAVKPGAMITVDSLSRVQAAQ